MHCSIFAFAAVRQHVFVAAVLWGSSTRRKVESAVERERERERERQRETPQNQPEMGAMSPQNMVERSSEIIGFRNRGGGPIGHSWGVQVKTRIADLKCLPKCNMHATHQGIVSSIPVQLVCSPEPSSSSRWHFTVRYRPRKAGCDLAAPFSDGRCKCMCETVTHENSRI